jgi:hypothetical protein
MMSTQTRAAAVLNYLTQHPNVEVHYQSIASALGMTPNQVFSGISSVRRRGKVTIDSPRKGFYIYRGGQVEVEPEYQATPKPVPHREAAEVVALLADGRLLVTVEGVVYVAEELVIP